MYEPKQCDRVDRLMQAPPAEAAEPTHHAVCRGRCEHRKPKPRDRTDDKIDAMRDLVKELAETVALIGKKQREVRGDIAERSDAEHAAHVDQIAVAKDSAKWRHRERHPEKDQRPKTSAVNELVERARAARDLARFEYRLGERHQQERKRDKAKDRQAAPPVAP